MKVIRVVLRCAIILLSVSALAKAQPAPAPSPTPTPATATKTAAAEVKVDAIGKSAILLPPEKTSPLRLVRFEKPPVIDGRLDDEAWKQAPLLKDFYQINPGDNISPSRRTEVWIGYDSRFLYLAVHAYDEPDKVRATVAKRDNVFGEDNVRFFLDTFNDQRKAYVLGFNPLGVQQDGILTEGSGTDFSVDIVMESKGMMTEDGWNVEVAIPFKSLRYEAGKGKLWGFHVWRNIDRFNDEIDSWMPISRDKTGTMSQAGHITGLEGVSTERTLEVIPSLTLSETGKRFRSAPPSSQPDIARAQDTGRLVNQPIEFDPGLTLKYGITPTITFDLALNPDFAQVEADQTVVTANQRFPIFFTEKRPFFLEGIDIFQTPLQAVHTRAIVDPDVAVKLSGKYGRNTFGLLLASDNAPGNYSEEERTDPDLSLDQRLRIERFLDKNAYIGVLRLKRDVGKESSLGMIATTYNFIDRHNHLLGIDGRFKVNPVTFFTFQALGTTTSRLFINTEGGPDERAKSNGFGYYWMYENSGRHFGYTLTGQGRTQDYRADVGFTRRRNTNFQDIFVRYNSEPNPKARLISWTVFNSLRGNYDWQGRLQNWEDEAQLQLNLIRTSYMGFGFVGGYERLFESEFGSTFFGGRPERSTYQASPYFYAGTTPSKKYSANVFILHTTNAFDLDFGAGPKFPRVSPAALSAAEAEQGGLCDVEDAPAVCNALQDPGRGGQWDIEFGITYKPTNALSTSLSFTKINLNRYDTGRMAFDDNIYVFRSTYQFTRFLFARARVDYDTLQANVRGQFLLGWTPNPGTAFYAGYNDDLNFNGYGPFTGRLEPGLRRNGRTFFIKMAYLFRRSF
ncbi:MAG TPA: DUF5916 domain-containing protein [Pyrinomonadaceae bacterium]|jgi:hypothetical protein